MASKYDDKVVFERAHKAMLEGLAAIEALQKCTCERCGPTALSFDNMSYDLKSEVAIKEL